MIIYEKPTVDVILNGKILAAFPLELGKRQGWFFLLLVFSIVILAIEIRQELELKGI